MLRWVRHGVALSLAAVAVALVWVPNDSYSATPYTVGPDCAEHRAGSSTVNRTAPTCDATPKPNGTRCGINGTGAACMGGKCT